MSPCKIEHGDLLEADNLFSSTFCSKQYRVTVQNWTWNSSCERLPAYSHLVLNNICITVQNWTSRSDERLQVYSPAHFVLHNTMSQYKTKMEILWKVASLFSSCFKQYMCHSTKLNMEIFWKLPWHKTRHAAKHKTTKLNMMMVWKVPSLFPRTTSSSSTQMRHLMTTLHSDLSNGCQLVLITNPAQCPFQWMPACSTCYLVLPSQSKIYFNSACWNYVEWSVLLNSTAKLRWFVISNFGWPAITVNNCDIQIPRHEQLFSFKRTRK